MNLKQQIKWLRKTASILFNAHCVVETETHCHECGQKLPAETVILKVYGYCLDNNKFRNDKNTLREMIQKRKRNYALDKA